MPTSTSSNTRVGMRDVCAVITWMARLMRDSSPPEATLARALRGCPGLALTSSSTCSRPLGSSSVLVLGRSSMVKRPPGMPRRWISCSTAWARLLEAWWRRSLSSRAFS
ncbi:hypothetical protein D3C75_1038290 [compost metagenome]